MAKNAGMARAKAPRKPQVIGPDNLVIDNPETEIAETEVAPERIDSVEKATAVLQAHVNANPVPDEVEIAYVTEDAQIFWDYNQSSAFAFAREKGLKIFELKLK